MRRLTLYLLVLVTVVSMLSGCGGSQKENPADSQPEAGSRTEDKAPKQEDASGSDNDDSGSTPSEPVQLTIWHDKEEAVASVLQAELDKLAPGIVVTLVKKEGLTDALKLVGNDPKSAPDMYFFAHDKIGVYAEMGILAPITDFIPEDFFTDYMEVTVSAAKYKGGIYQLPLYYETLLFMYNKEYMSAEEVPATTEALYRYMKENTSGDRYGFVEQHSTAYYSVPWIHGFGGALIDDQGTAGLNSAESVQALAYHKKFVDLMPGESDYNTVNILFLEGMADSIIGGPWLVPSIRSRGIDLGFAPMPVVDETGLPLVPYSGTQGLQVLKVAAEKKKDAITKVLTQLTNTDIGIAMANASGCAPANKLCYEDASVKQDEMVMMMKETAQKAVPMPNIPEMDVMWSVTSNMLASVNMGGEDPAAEAAKAQKEAENLIAAMK
jgi:arabinogalactan oligomer/maltooligosaccharide transport system substrate-binding protein